MAKRIAGFMFLLTAFGVGSVWAASGKQHLEAARGKTLEKITRTLTPIAAKPDVSEKLLGGTLVCKSKPVTSEAIRDLINSPLLRLSDAWPGQLLQGKFLAKGQFVPILNERSGGRLLVKGLQFKDEGASDSVLIDEMSEANVNSALGKLLSQPADFEASVAFSIKEFYSAEQAAFDLGADDRFSSMAWSSMFYAKPNMNHFLLAQTQIYYTVAVEDPQELGDFFKEDLDKLEDKSNAFGADNPPVYVKDVSYGAMKYVLASSRDPAASVKSALDAAIIGKETPADKAVLANTSFTAYAMGAADRPPSFNGTPEKNIEELKDFFSPQPSKRGQGVPILATFNYLVSRAPVSLQFATSYDKRVCEIIKD